jgi:uncharacterized protein YebE (UPF0316 family)
MEVFFLEKMGVSPELFYYLVLPLMIFIARICDVSINTIRIIFVMTGRKFVATVLGFFESLIWLLAIGQIFKHIDNLFSYIAYPAGFAMGILVGMLIEERLALGKVVVRIITRKDIEQLIDFLKKNKIRYSIMKSEGPDGPENILFTVLRRDSFHLLEEKITEYIPTAFYTVEGVKSASEAGMLTEQPSRRGIGSWLSSVKRK